MQEKTKIFWICGILGFLTVAILTRQDAVNG
jgi:hypothetical protein